MMMTIRKRRVEQSSSRGPSLRRATSTRRVCRLDDTAFRVGPGRVTPRE